MGDVSVFARRLGDGHVQYGWSGNGGYMKNTGYRLQFWYTEPDMVEYLFSLGQTRFIGEPGSEKGGSSWAVTHALTGEPCWLGTSENDIFSKIAFVDYGYFYDKDNKWYYIQPGLMNLKISMLALVIYMKNNDKHYEFDFLDKARAKLHRYILFDLAEKDRDFAGYLNNEGIDIAKARETCNKEEADGMRPFDFESQYKKAFDYFDDWATVDITLKESGDRYEDPEITGFGLVKKSEPHIETCDRSDFGRTVRYLAEDGTEEFE